MSRSQTTFTVGQLSIAGDWEDRFLLTCTAAQFRARGRRKTGKGAPDQIVSPETDESRLFRDLAAERRRSRNATIQRRWEVGYVHRGGSVGGNPAYRRPPFVFKGLVSDEAAILKLFATKTPRARRLLTGATKDIVEGTDSKLLALDSAYVTTTQRMRGVLRVEIDAYLASWTVLPEICAKADVPLPNIAVGYVDASGQVRNPHLIWLLENSVAFTPQARPAPKYLFSAALRGLTAALVSHGADPGGLSNPRRMKNPLSPLWNRAVFVRTPYALGDFRKLANAPAIAALQAAANLTQRPPAQDHADAAVAVHSNWVFRTLATWARQEVTAFRNAGLRERFHVAIEDEAYRLCQGLHGDNRRAEQTIRGIAQSIAQWTWEKYTPKSRSAKLTRTEVHERQAAAGRATAAGQRAATEAALLKEATALARQNAGVITKSDLIAATGLSESTIRRRWPTVASALAKQARAEAETAGSVRRSPDDKKSLVPEPPGRHTSAPSVPPLSFTFREQEIINDAQSASLPAAAIPPLTCIRSCVKTQTQNGTVSFRSTDDHQPTPQRPRGRPTYPPGPENPSKHPVPLTPRSQPAAPDDPDDGQPRPTLDLTPRPLNLTPRLPTKELAHAAPLPALNAQLLIGQNVLIENVSDEAIGPFTERYRSLLKTFLLRTDTTLHREATEQTGADVWKKMWRNSQSRGYAHLRDCNLLALYLEPRQELRLKTAREAFKRETIDYAAVLGTLIWHRLAHGLPTWIFTPRRLDDPEFITVYGPTLAGLLDTSFAPIRFGEGSAEQVTRGHPLDPGHLRWLDAKPPSVFVHPETGAITSPGDCEPHPPPAADAKVDQPIPSRPRTTQPTRTAGEADTSPYAAQMARARQEYARVRYRSLAPPRAPELPTIAAEPSSGRSSQLPSPGTSVTQPPVRRTFRHDYTLPAPTPQNDGGFVRTLIAD